MALWNITSLALLAFVILSLFRPHGCIGVDEVRKQKPGALINPSADPPSTPCSKGTCSTGKTCWCCSVKGLGYCYDDRKSCLAGCGCQPATCGAKKSNQPADTDIKCWCCTLYGKLVDCFPTKEACIGGCGN